MGLFKKVFGERAPGAGAGGPASTSEFPDTGEPPGSSWRSQVRSRREAVHVVLREAMRKHAIPADWIESRLLVDVDDPRLLTFTILLHVRDGHSSLRGYAATFEASFLDALHHFDPRAREWLAGVCWTFAASAEATDLASAAAAVAAGHLPSSAPDSRPPAFTPPHAPDGTQELEEDLQALFAIRDAALGKAPPAG